MGDGPGGLFLALLTGYRDGLSPEESRIFREAGCSHILALSGMHLGILSGVILFILRPLPGRKPAFLISCVLILCYLFLTGFGISLVRAALMYFLYGLNSAFYRKSRGIDVLILSFVIVTAASPASFYTLSFQLSFLAVGGMLVAAPAFERLFQAWLPSFIRTPLAFSAGAQLPVIPLLMLSFGVIYPVGLIAGIIIAPMVTLFIWAGLVFLVTDLKAVSFFADLVYKAVYKAADTASGAPSVSFGGSAWQTALIVSGLAAVLFISSIRRRNLYGVSDKLRFPR
jgi:competence protein ComEC